MYHINRNVFSCVLKVVRLQSVRINGTVSGLKNCTDLWSASTECIQLPREQTSIRQRSFAFYSLPSAPSDSNNRLTLNTIGRRLKTDLFRQRLTQSAAVVAFQ